MMPAGNIPLGSVLGNTILPADLETAGLDFFFGLDSTGVDIIATSSFMGPVTMLCPPQVTLAQIQPLTTPPTFFPPFHIDIGQGTFHPINFFLSPDATRAYIVASDRTSVLIYNLNTNSVSAIPLFNNASPVAADITVDGTLIYIAGSDGLLHEVSIPLSADEYQISFSPLANSPNSFCYTGNNCTLDMVAVKP
jgi:DNA-binding beta-propeller fold protein YncE